MRYPPDFWFPLGLPCLQVDPMAARKGDLVLYFGDLFPTEARKLPSCPRSHSMNRKGKPIHPSAPLVDRFTKPGIEIGDGSGSRDHHMLRVRNLGGHSGKSFQSSDEMETVGEEVNVEVDGGGQDSSCAKVEVLIPLASSVKEMIMDGSESVKCLIEESNLKSAGNAVDLIRNNAKIVVSPKSDYVAMYGMALVGNGSWVSLDDESGRVRLMSPLLRLVRQYNALTSWLATGVGVINKDKDNLRAPKKASSDQLWVNGSGLGDKSKCEPEGILVHGLNEIPNGSKGAGLCEKGGVNRDP
ncbi:hypothetical protein Patl1_18114 [Pistacia atlantica]|uniref:Uncharacterized protein n=1 Tax=Pistacia atlantica TaxID=434234 RepID=A0ACC1BXC6_9ROSI|nr:hypothetical protein Patl1_18114 [Pistacia atlantica]